MKQIVALMVMMLAWAAVPAASAQTPEPSAAEAQSGKKQPDIEFVTRNHDFGAIKEADGSVTCEFEFRNTGKAPLVIVSANAGCGCTRPVFDDKPVAPGASSVIKVTYNPKGRPGEFTKNVTVRTNSPKHKKVILKISGTVIPM